MNYSEQPSLLAVDIGNRQVKLGWFPDVTAMPLPEPAATAKLAPEGHPWERLPDWLPPVPLTWLIASVQRQTESRLSRWVGTHRPDDRYRLLEVHQLPIEICVDVPDAVGPDRLLAGIAVNRLRSRGRPAVVVDAGSAITVDLIGDSGAFEGGVILPGFGMIAAALAEGTDRLPQVEGTLPDNPPPVIGKSTEGAIRSGLFWGNVGAVREVVTRMSDQLGVEPELFVAGGDAEPLASRLQIEARIVQDLVLSGIAVASQTLARVEADTRH